MPTVCANITSRRILNGRPRFALRLIKHYAMKAYGGAGV
jgi:hypothetical protein